VNQIVSADGTFEALRGRLFGLAYRMLGSRAEAEDIVQEAYLRWHETDRRQIENPEAWLVTAATRLAIDRLRRLKTEREAYTGPWLPEPMVTRTPSPDYHLDLADDLSIAFLTLLERLAPEERAAFLLHDVFDVGYGEIAGVLPACSTEARPRAGRWCTAPANAFAAIASVSKSPTPPKRRCSRSSSRQWKREMNRRCWPSSHLTRHGQQTAAAR
jgi:RNA polymerase sigma factor (sigma-70 family)